MVSKSKIIKTGKRLSIYVPSHHFFETEIFPQHVNDVQKSIENDLIVTEYDIWCEIQKKSIDKTYQPVIIMLLLSEIFTIFIKIFEQFIRQ